MPNANMISRHRQQNNALQDSPYPLERKRNAAKRLKTPFFRRQRTRLLIAGIMFVYTLVCLYCSHHITSSTNSEEVSFVRRINQASMIVTLPMPNKSNRKKIPVVVWPNVEHASETAASLHLETNGIDESPYLDQSNDLWNFDDNVVWLADVASYAHSEREFCQDLGKRVEEAIETRTRLGLPTRWPVIIMDWTDYGMDVECELVEKKLSLKYVKYTQRSTVWRRKWNETSDWVDAGKLHPDKDILFQHTPMPVRTDTVETLAHVLQQHYNASLAFPIETIERNIDVSHFWPIDSTGVRNVQGAKLRRKVSQTVSQVGKQHNLTVHVGLAGHASTEGRRSVDSHYVETMLKSKIVVVTQRDLYEDHYRLFEALVSGSMVMTDRMLGIPAGLGNGTSLVEFESAHELEQQILYYLQYPDERLEIARQGRLVAMSRHRTWHRMEEIVFGRVVSGCSGAETGSDCPWMVHANERSGESVV